ncbi:hypothetical protein GCM10027037_19370 [Mucilaginibacter koreensis]
MHTKFDLFTTLESPKYIVTSFANGELTFIFLFKNRGEAVQASKIFGHVLKMDVNVNETIPEYYISIKFNDNSKGSFKVLNEQKNYKAMSLLVEAEIKIYSIGYYILTGIPSLLVPNYHPLILSVFNDC